MSLLVLTNLLNYVDRGVIPGASGEFTSFVESSREFDGAGASAAFGALTSAFIVGYSVACVVVGHLVHHRSPFKMTGVGLVLWCVAAVLAALAKPARSYTVLLLARMLSGVGEAGFVTVGGPFIQDAGGARQGLWLGVFYAAIPTGTAIGYGYGAAIAAEWTWPVAFYCEAIAMLPLAYLFYRSRDDGSRVVAARPSGVDDDAETAPPTVKEELAAIVHTRTFAWVSLGYAGYTGAVIGFSTFGPSIVVGLGLWDDQTAASLAFSGTLAFSGLVGTTLGGVLLDAWVSHKKGSRLRRALEASILLVLVGMCCIAPAAFATRRGEFLAYLAAGTLPLFAATTPMNVAVFESVPRRHRAFAQSVATLAMHAFGDVPTPVVIGVLKDALAPACTPDGKGHLGDACTEQRQRGDLRGITFGCACYFGFSVLAFAIARFRAPRGDDEAAPEGLEAPLLEASEPQWPGNCDGDVAWDDGWEALLSDPALVLVDCRTAGEVSDHGSIPGGLHYSCRMGEDPLAVVEAANVSDRSAPILVYCAVGGRSRRVAAAFVASGYSNAKNGGGVDSVRLALASLDEAGDRVTL